MKEKKHRFVISGGGVVGICIAKALRAQGHRDILVLEKEPALSRHASGRNSGVLHAGVYYPADTLKAKFCLEGNRRLKKYCKDNAIPLIETGKVIVAKSKSEIDVLETLYSRTQQNGADACIIDEKELSKIEPFAQTYRQALYSKETAITDPKQVMAQLEKECQEDPHINILYNTEVSNVVDENTICVKTAKGQQSEYIRFEYFVNAAGAHAEKIAHQFQLGLDYTLIPFKGVYKKLCDQKASLVNGNIYPVPDLRNPFLGVHFTRSVSGDVYVGPTAMPVFGRENYHPKITAEAMSILIKEMTLFILNPKFRSVALTEPLKYVNAYFYNDAKQLVKNLEKTDLRSSAKVGIRPQLVNWRTKELVQDFKLVKTKNSIHVLNAISPAFTSSLPFADYVVDQIELGQHEALN